MAHSPSNGQGDRWQCRIAVLLACGALCSLTPFTVSGQDVSPPSSPVVTQTPVNSDALLNSDLQAEVERQARELAELRALIYGQPESWSGVTGPVETGQTDLQQRIEKLEQQLQSPVPTAKVEKKSDAPTLKMGGQVIVDGLWFHQNADSRAAVGDLDDALDFRRARLYGTGKAYQIFSYAIGFDFAQGSGDNGRPAFIDNWMQVEDLPWVNHLRIGHFFEPFSLERSSSNRNTMFMERSLADAFAPARNTGAMVFNQTEDQSFYWALGTFRGNSDNFGDDGGDREGQTVDARFAWRPIYDELNGGDRVLHLGYAYSFRGASDGKVQFRSRPEAFGHGDAEAISTPYFTNTGNLDANSSQLHGMELLWIHGPFSLQGEYMLATVDRESGLNNQFHGGYLSASYFLTGEHRAYNREQAILDRVTPHNNFLRSFGDSGPLIQGWGAWEVAARLSQIDLTNRDVAGGRLTDFTAGINWYLTPYNRVKVNYVLANLDQPAQGTTRTSIFGVRFDTDF